MTVIIELNTKRSIYQVYKKVQLLHKRKKGMSDMITKQFMYAFFKICKKKILHELAKSHYKKKSLYKHTGASKQSYMNKLSEIKT